jgi:hypothetical protein
MWGFCSALTSIVLAHVVWLWYLYEEVPRRPVRSDSSFYSVVTAINTKRFINQNIIEAVGDGCRSTRRQLIFRLKNFKQFVIYLRYFKKKISYNLSSFPSKLTFVSEHWKNGSSREEIFCFQTFHDVDPYYIGSQ